MQNTRRCGYAPAADLARAIRARGLQVNHRPGASHVGRNASHCQHTGGSVRQDHPSRTRPTGLDRPPSVRPEQGMTPRDIIARGPRTGPEGPSLLAAVSDWGLGVRRARGPRQRQIVRLPEAARRVHGIRRRHRREGRQRHLARRPRLPCEAVTVEPGYLAGRLRPAEHGSARTFEYRMRFVLPRPEAVSCEL